MTNPQATLLYDSKSVLGEGPLWDLGDQRLWWLDVEQGLVQCFDPATEQNESHDVGQLVGTVVRREKGGLMLALKDGFAEYTFGSRSPNLLADPEPNIDANRFNDGKCDPAGRFWAGTMNYQDESQSNGALYCLHSDGRITKHAENIGVSNGIVWTSDATKMYYIDSPTRTIDAFDYVNATGEITNRRAAFVIPEGMGYPDGMAIDSEEMLWVALWNGWGVGRFHPMTGELLQKIDVPALQTTACAFGGPELKDLFITTARRGLKGDALQGQPNAGGLFHYKTDVAGVPSVRFAG